MIQLDVIILVVFVQFRFRINCGLVRIYIIVVEILVFLCMNEGRSCSIFFLELMEIL